MKLKYLFPLFVAAIALLASCESEDPVTLLEKIQVSSSYITIPEAGGSSVIVVTAQDEWTVEKVLTEKDSLEWLTVSQNSGSVGESKLTFTAVSTLDGRTAEVLLHCGNQTQRLIVMQGLPKVSEATAADVIAGPDGKTYQVTGICTSISNTTYGNWYLTDETGTIYIYGTLDEKDAEKNFLSLGLEVGDEVTVQGPKTTYGTTIELVNVTVININKSLVKVDSVENEELPIEGGLFTAHLTCKGQGVSVEIPEDAKSWMSIYSIQQSGTDAVVKFSVAENNGGDRGTTITFSTTDGTKTYTTQASLTQKGAIVDASVAEFLEAEVGDTQYRLSGVITEISNTKYGNLYIQDYSGKAYVYGIEDFEDKNLKVGDVITIVGKRAAYKDSPQVGGAVLESVIPVTPVTIAEVLDKPDSQSDYYKVTGVITSIKNATYGNLYLKDGDSEIYLYGCYPGWGATEDARKGLIDAKGIKVGDTLTVIATKTTYNDTPQLSGGIYFSHESAE